MLIAAVLAGIGLAAYAAVKMPTRVTLFRGQERRIVFADGSTPERAARLRALFDNVVDEGSGVYRVTPVQDGVFTLPKGASIV